MRQPSTTKTMTPCCSKVGIKKGPWTPEEDELLSNYINREGEGRWRTLPKRAGLLRCGKSCRLRWMNYLRPSVKHGRIAPDEEDLILRLHRLLGNRWSLIAGRIPGRTDNEIKNYWNTHLSKKLISQGIDPRTHKPLNNPLPSPSPPPPAAANAIVASSSQVQIQESNPNSAAAGGSYYDHHQQQQQQISLLQPDQVMDNNNDMMGYYVGNCLHEDTFSTFLDSLMNDNTMFINSFNNNNQQLQIIEPEHGGGAIWDSSSTGLAGDQNAMGHHLHHHHHHPNSS